MLRSYAGYAGFREEILQKEEISRPKPRYAAKSKERRKKDKEKVEKRKENRLGFARSAKKLELEEIGTEEI